MLTVVGPAGNSGGLALRGLFVGDDEECFQAAAKLSLEVNFTLVPRPIEKVRDTGEANNTVHARALGSGSENEGGREGG